MESLHLSLITTAKGRVPDLFALQIMCWNFFVEVESSRGAGFSEAIESKTIDVVRVISFVLDVVNAVGVIFAFCHFGRG